MANKSTFRRHATHVLLGVFICAASLYFSHTGLQGEYGVFTKLRVEKERRTLSAQRDVLTADRIRYENLTNRLGDQNLDLDLLDERARDVLGYYRADEVLIR